MRLAAAYGMRTVGVRHSGTAIPGVDVVTANLPEALRASDEPCNDNTSRAHESAAGASGIQDELSEAIQLDTCVHPPAPTRSVR